MTFYISEGTAKGPFPCVRPLTMRASSRILLAIATTVWLPILASAPTARQVSHYHMSTPI
jgi:hypothetical protein